MNRYRVFIPPRDGVTPCEVSPVRPCRNPACPTCSPNVGAGTRPGVKPSFATPSSATPSSATPSSVKAESSLRDPHLKDPQIPASTSAQVPTPAPAVVPDEKKIPAALNAPALNAPNQDEVAPEVLDAAAALNPGETPSEPQESLSGLNELAPLNESVAPEAPADELDGSEIPEAPADELDGSEIPEAPADELDGSEIPEAPADELEELASPQEATDWLPSEESGQMMKPLAPSDSGVRVLEAPSASELDFQDETPVKENPAPLRQNQPKRQSAAVPAQSPVQSPALNAAQSPVQAPAQSPAPNAANQPEENDSELSDLSELSELPTLDDAEENAEESDAEDAEEDAENALPGELELPDLLEPSDVSGASGSRAEKVVRPQIPLKKALKPQAAVRRPSSALLADQSHGLRQMPHENGRELQTTSNPMNISAEMIRRSTKFNAQSAMNPKSSLQTENRPIQPNSDSRTNYATERLNASGISTASDCVSTSDDISFAVVAAPVGGAASVDSIRLTAAEEPASAQEPAALDMNSLDLASAEKRLSTLERPSFAQPADEYVIDTKSSAQKIDLPNPQKLKVGGQEMDDNWEARLDNQSGTFIYFDNGQGRATIQSPDPVFIYAPRFRAVRQVMDLNIDEQVLSTGDLYSPTEVSIQGQNLETSTTRQNLQTRTELGRDVMLQAKTSAGTGQMDGLVAPQVQAQEAVIAQENRSVLGPNVSEGKTRAWSADGAIFVNAWTKNEELRVFIEKESASVSVQNLGVPSLYTVKEGSHKQDVRIAKVASTTSAKPGETIDFIIYFENTGQTPVGNITLVDNLPARLEIVEDSAESSVDSSFSYEINGSGSQTLRWEITQPLYAGEKGAVKFKALVR